VGGAAARASALRTGARLAGALAQLADALEAGIAFPAAGALVAESGPARPTSTKSLKWPA
jgi:hypothetical protein